MTNAQLNKKLEHIIEQKIIELYGDPDAGLEFKKSFVDRLRRSMRSKNRKLVPHSEILKKYGLR
ncbi:MAG: hypothetical protein AAB734_00720 [Patescibacteria group bacterium]